MPSRRRSRPPARQGSDHAPLRAIGHGGRLRELSLVEGGVGGPGAESGSALLGLHNRVRVGGCKGPGEPYITRGSGEVGSRPIPVARSPGRGRSGREDARGLAAPVYGWASRRRGLGAVSQEGAGQGAWLAWPTGEWSLVSLLHL